MPPPKRGEHLNWDGLLRVARFNLGITPKEFWKLTFYEYWALYEAIEPKNKKPPMKVEDVNELQRKWLGGNIRRVSSQPSGRNPRSKKRTR